LKENRETKRIPVVFLTAVLTPEDENVNLKNRFIAEPVLPEGLISRIDSILNRAPLINLPEEFLIYTVLQEFQPES